MLGVEIATFLAPSASIIYSGPLATTSNGTARMIPPPVKSRPRQIVFRVAMIRFVFWMREYWYLGSGWFQRFRCVFSESPLLRCLYTFRAFRMSIASPPLPETALGGAPPAGSERRGEGLLNDPPPAPSAINPPAEYLPTARSLVSGDDASSVRAEWESDSGSPPLPAAAAACLAVTPYRS